MYTIYNTTTLAVINDAITCRSVATMHAHAFCLFLSLYSMSSNPTAKSSFFDLFKPRYHEATFRLKNSLIASIALLTLTHLLPLPTLYTSAWKFYRNSFHSSWEKSLAIAGTIPQQFLLR